MSKLLLQVWVFFIFFIALFPSPNEAYNVVDFGARGDGRSDSTVAFTRAWAAACGSVRAANVYVPRGTFVIRQVTFKGPCRNRILFQIDGTLVTPSDYRALGNSGFWILFHQVNRLSVIGGTIDARGTAFWNCRRNGQCPQGARSLTFLWCNDVLLSGLTSLYSQFFHIAIGRCNNMMIQNIRTIAPSMSPNTDGIHIEHSTGITISRSTFRTGDDCISLGPGTRNLWIERIACGPGHGISIGSLGNGLNEEGVQNVTVVNTVFTKTDNGVRIKSWGRASNSFARNIVFRNIIMRGVNNPIFIDQTYCPNNQCPRQNSGVQISDVTFQNIKGTSATEEAITLDCSRSNPCRGIRLDDINLRNPNRVATAICTNAGGSTRGVVIPRSCLGR